MVAVKTSSIAGTDASPKVKPRAAAAAAAAAMPNTAAPSNARSSHGPPVSLRYKFSIPLTR